MSLADQLRDAAARMAAVSDTPRLDAELLAAHALATTRERMLIDGPERLAAVPGLEALVTRRLAHEPIAYITGRRGFWTIELAVGPGALVPRPDSETLIEAAVAHYAGTAGPRTVLDLGTGPGTLLLAALAEWPTSMGVGIDRSAEALSYARANAEALDVADRALLVEGEWEAAPATRVDLLLANPPYVATGAALPEEVRAHEPAGALFAGVDGLDDYRRIAPLVADRLAAGGVGCIEIGFDQGATAAALFEAAGLSVALRRDLGGCDRCLVVRLA